MAEDLSMLMGYPYIFVQLHYTFQRFMLLQEPLLVVGAFYLLFLAVIVYVRLDFSITKVR